MSECSPKLFDERTPLLERAKFLAIFTSNLDEFFMKRQAVLRSGTTDAQRALLQQLRDKLLPSLRRQAECYRQVIVPGLAEHGVFLRSWNQLTPRQQEEGSKYFKSEVSPALTPLVIDPVHPFPFLSNLSNSLVFRLRDLARDDHVRPGEGSRDAKAMDIAGDRSKPGQKLLVPLHEIIRGNLHSLYNGMEISNVTIMRITRDAEVEIDDGPAADFRTMVKEQIRQRRYEPVVRLEFCAGADPAITEMLSTRFELGPVDVYEMQEELDYTTLFELMGFLSLHCETRNGRRFGRCRCQWERALFLPPCKELTCWYTTLTRALTRVLSTLSVRRRMIRKPSPLR